MGQTNYCSCTRSTVTLDEDQYIDLPLITHEDVRQIRTCFEYFEPHNGTVNSNNIRRLKPSCPSYMQDLLSSLEHTASTISFDDFYSLMKPKVIELKSLSHDSVELDDTAARVFCFLFPFKNKS